MDSLDALPAWLKWIGSGVAGLAAGAVFLRQYLSQAKVDRAANDVNAQTIERLFTQMSAERERADRLMHEREAMVLKIGELTGKVDALRSQLETLTNLVHALKVGQ